MTLNRYIVCDSNRSEGRAEAARASTCDSPPNLSECRSINMHYSGTCLNRPAKEPGHYGLFIQVVYLDKVEILDQIPITVSDCEEMVSD